MPSPTAVPTERATAPQSGFIRADRLPELVAKQKALNGLKKPAFIPNAIKEESRKKQLFIFNVGPKRLEGSGASYGRMPIPACPDGAEHSEPLVIAGLPHEYYNKEGNTLEVQFHGSEDEADPGYDFACQVMLGFTDPKGQWNGKFLSPSNSLEKFGVGISRVWPPKKEDIELARRKMLAEYSKLVQQAREAHAVGKLSAVVTDDHFVAAHALGLTAETERWLEFSAPAKDSTKQSCPNCRKVYEPGTVVHDCGFIIDKKQHDDWVREGRIAATK